MWNDFKAWAAGPFSADMDAVHWFYFLGLVIVISLAWGMVIRAIQRAAE